MIEKLSSRKWSGEEKRKMTARSITSSFALEYAGEDDAGAIRELILRRCDVDRFDVACARQLTAMSLLSLSNNCFESLDHFHHFGATLQVRARVHARALERERGRERERECVCVRERGIERAIEPHATLLRARVPSVRAVGGVSATSGGMHTLAPRRLASPHPVAPLHAGPQP